VSKGFRGLVKRSPFVLFFVVLGLDQASKSLVLGMKKGDFPLLPGYLNISVAYNTGAAFGILPSCQWIFVLISTTVLGVVFYLLRRKLEAVQEISLLLLAGGVAGNLVDRLWRGFVVDFIELRYAGKRIWPTFNLADVAITAGVLLLLLKLNAGRIQNRPHKEH
jgi:signal peptidase II